MGGVGAVCALMLMLAGGGAAETIDRVLAVVDGQIITLSDGRAALKLGLVPPDVADDPIAAVLQRLIDRRLALAEVERYAAPEPPPAAVDAALAAIRSRFADALAFEIAINQTAMSHEELRRFVLDSLRIEAYAQQRFASAIQPTDEDLARYHREHREAFTVGGALRPLDEVREQVRALVAAERQDVLVREWLEGLRRRGSVIVLYLPVRG